MLLVFGLLLGSDQSLINTLVSERLFWMKIEPFVLENESNKRFD